MVGARLGASAKFSMTGACSLSGIPHTQSAAWVLQWSMTRSSPLRFSSLLVFPPPKRSWCTRSEEAVRAAESITGPVVIKPRDGIQSKGVSTGLVGAEEIREGFAFAQGERQPSHSPASYRDVRRTASHGLPGPNCPQ